MTDELAAVEEDWRRIVADRDVAGAEQLLADDFLLSSAGGFGDRVTRDEWLAGLPAVETESLACEVLDTRLFGEIAVVRARLDWEASAGGRDLSGSYVVADTFRSEGGRWRAVWRISTRLGA